MTDQVPIADQVACAKRELRLREGVYPKMIESRRISADAAARELKRMAAIVQTLEALMAVIVAEDER